MADHTLETWKDLAYCTTCGGAEGSLSTDCPGMRMTAGQEARVMARCLDYRAGRWETKAVRGLVIRLHDEGPLPGCPLVAIPRWGSGGTPTRA